MIWKYEAENSASYFCVFVSTFMWFEGHIYRKQREVCCVMKRFISFLIALILFLTMIFPNLNHLLAESSKAADSSDITVSELTEF